MALHAALNNEVSLFLADLAHPFIKEIEVLRSVILNADSRLDENIKWNGPNYSFKDEDRITMRILPPKQQIQLIFHRGSKKQAQPENKLIKSGSTILTWKENDRAIATFRSMQDIQNSKTELSEVIKDWISVK
ncbi:MAG: hypothetical protein K0Q95_1875 [Bacteroidota bacterium]|jgi:hypothetical protein|nr:hypothetical protein [Bacteroidota bacterium]